MNKLLAAIQERILIGDGAYSTMFQQMGYCKGGEMSDPYNLTRPEVVTEIYRRYLEAGADLLETNTFNANRLRLPRRLAHQVHTINYQGAMLARKLIGEEGLLFGSIGPTGRMLYPYGDIKAEDLHLVFKEQGRALKEGGVDGYIVETMMDIRELRVAVMVCRELGLPVIAQMTFQKNLHTLMGNTVEEFVVLGSELEVDVLGFNCIENLELALQLVERARQITDQPLSLYPNAGIPELKGKEAVYPLTAADFARAFAGFAAHGVRIFGGCCGTTPAYIAALKKRETTYKGELDKG